MAKRSAKKPKAEPKRPRDVNQLAHYLIRQATEQNEAEEKPAPTTAEISRVMAELGRRGGRIGGKARAARMAPERRREIALKAARKRWDATR